MTEKTTLVMYEAACDGENSWLGNVADRQQLQTVDLILYRPQLYRGGGGVKKASVSYG